jgi:hypothetical protein
VSRAIGWSLAAAALLVVAFFVTDCGMGKKVSCRGRITFAEYQPSRTWTTVNCHRSGKATICLPENHYEPEHFWATVSTPLGRGRFDDRELYSLAPSGECTARFSQGRWTGHIWGPTACELGGYWPMREAQ